MDRFVVRTARSANIRCDLKTGNKTLKQSRISELKGVVVIEDILRYRSLLRQPDQSHEVILDCLHALNKKIPARDILKSTKIGHTVKRLIHHENRDVAKLSQEIVDKWLSHYAAKLTSPLIDVKCDNETERIRAAGRKHLTEALRFSSVSEEVSGFSQAIELELFQQHKNLIDSKYKKTLRRIIFALRNQESLRKDVLESNATSADVVEKFECL